MPFFVGGRLRHRRICGPFERLDPEGEGSGLGLALVQRIVEAHRGRVWIESNGAGGTTVRFFLPATGIRPSPPSVPG